MSYTPRTKLWAGPLALALAAVMVTGVSAQRDQQDDDLRDEQRFEPIEEQYESEERELRDEPPGDEPRERRVERRPLDEEREARDMDRREEAGLGISIARDERPGIIVARVFRDSPAEQMGLRRGDRITHVNQEPIRTTRDFVSRIREMRPGEEVELDVLRDREEFVVRGDLEAREEAFPRERPRIRPPWQRDVPDRFARDPRFPRDPDPRRIRALEWQVERLNRELQELRFALRQLRGQPPREWDGETAARYEEFETDRGWDGARQQERWDEGRRYEPRWEDQQRWDDELRRGPRFRDERRPDDRRN